MTARLTTLSAFALASVAMSGAAAQDAPRGFKGEGHEQHHRGFYDGLLRNDTGGSCCNDSDCRPTQTRVFRGAREVMVNGEWLPIPARAILRKRSPDGLPHVCAQERTVVCVVLEPET